MTTLESYCYSRCVLVLLTVAWESEVSSNNSNDFTCLVTIIHLIRFQQYSCSNSKTTQNSETLSWYVGRKPGNLVRASNICLTWLRWLSLYFYYIRLKITKPILTFSDGVFKGNMIRYDRSPEEIKTYCCKRQILIEIKRFLLSHKHRDKSFHDFVGQLITFGLSLEHPMLVLSSLSTWPVTKSLKRNIAGKCTSFLELFISASSVSDMSYQNFWRVNNTRCARYDTSIKTNTKTTFLTFSLLIAQW